MVCIYTVNRVTFKVSGRCLTFSYILTTSDDIVVAVPVKAHLSCTMEAVFVAGFKIFG